MVLVDTTVWSLALRRRKHALSAPELRIVDALKELIASSSVAMTGVIRQELLSGIRTTTQFETLRGHLHAYVDLQPARSTYELAAEYSNRCRAHGIQSSLVDILLCALAAHYQMPIFTTDPDFKHYAQHCEIQLYNVA